MEIPGTRIRQENNIDAKLVLFGGTPVKSMPIPAWSYYNEKAKRILMDFLESRI